MKEYPITHQNGTIFLENLDIHFGGSKENNQAILKDKNLGIQIAADGRIWLCIDGVAFFRFKPNRTNR